MKARRRDLNDKLISDALKKAGFNVHCYAAVGKVPDKLVSRPLPTGLVWTCWLEIKSETGKLRPSQILFQQLFEAKREFYVARDPEDTIKQLSEWYQAAIQPEHLR